MRAGKPMKTSIKVPLDYSEASEASTGTRSPKHLLTFLFPCRMRVVGGRRTGHGFFFGVLDKLYTDKYRLAYTTWLQQQQYIQILCKLFTSLFLRVPVYFVWCPTWRKDEGRLDHDNTNKLKRMQKDNL